MAGNFTGEGTGDERRMQADMHGLLDHRKEFRLSILSAIGRQTIKSFKQGSDMKYILKSPFLFMTTWMDLEDVMLSKVSQRKILHDITYTCNLKKLNL